MNAHHRVSHDTWPAVAKMISAWSFRGTLRIHFNTHEQDMVCVETSNQLDAADVKAIIRHAERTQARQNRKARNHLKKQLMNQKEHHHADQH